MKRHVSLVPLSREHHQMLILTQLLKKNTPDYKGLPSDTSGKAKYALNMYAQLIQEHFQVEELIFAKLSTLNTSLTSLTIELASEHQQINTLFNQLSKSASTQLLHKLGLLLEKHIRKEERVLFQQVQECIPEDQLIELGKQIEKWKKTGNT